VALPFEDRRRSRRRRCCCRRHPRAIAASDGSMVRALLLLLHSRNRRDAVGFYRSTIVESYFSLSFRSHPEHLNSIRATYRQMNALGVVVSRYTSPLNEM
jgi:hypothetical protein